MDIIKMARDLGTEIQKTEEYITLTKAKKANEADTVLNEQIGRFNLVKLEIQAASSKENPDNEVINRKNEELKTLYQEIMQNKNMAVFQKASDDINSMLNKINRILSSAVNGEDPQSCSTEQTCSGSCEGCSGCA